jgi:rRNA large subunit m3Psi methyltransferase RlmH
MRIKIVSFGQRLPIWINQGVAEYLNRLPRDWSVDLVELKPEPRGQGKSIAQILTLEARRVLASCENAVKIVLDERGQSWTTRQLADHMTQWRLAARDVSLIVGSADGLDASLKKEADQRWSLSPLTLPHGIVRIVLAEQLYRAVSLLNNHPYHRE